MVVEIPSLGHTLDEFLVKLFFYIYFSGGMQQKNRQKNAKE